jgi:hypothetical protein
VRCGRQVHFAISLILSRNSCLAVISKSAAKHRLGPNLVAVGAY